MTIQDIINMDIEKLELLPTKELEAMLQPLIAQSRAPLPKTGTALKKARATNVADILTKANLILKQPSLL